MTSDLAAPTATLVPTLATESLGVVYERRFRLADLMARAKLVPEHLRGSPGDCFLVVSQAEAWGMDPLAVAQCTSVVHGKLMYEGKLVAAVVYARHVLTGRFTWDLSGEGESLAIVLRGTLRGETEPREIRGTLKNWRTVTKKDGVVIPNNWDKDPRSQIVYRAMRQWARLYTPELMMGVSMGDEAAELVEATDVVVRDDRPMRTKEVAPEVGKAALADAPAPAPAPGPLDAVRAAFNRARAATSHKQAADVVRQVSGNGAETAEAIPADKREAVARALRELAGDA